MRQKALLANREPPMCHLTWQAPKWDRLSNRKHRKANVRNWERSLTTGMTGDGDETSQFDPTITDAELSQIQLECVINKGTLVRDSCHKRTYFQDVGKIIGASAGVQTSLIFVEYVN